MPDAWADWDERVKQTGRPTRVAEELNDLELLILLSDDNPRRLAEKQMLRQEAYRRMGHPDAVPPGSMAQGGPEALSGPSERGPRSGPF